MKIIDKINRVTESGGTTVSFEFFPAKTEAGVDNLLRRIENMGLTLHPTFVTLTWRSAFKDEKLWLKIGSVVQRQFGLDVLLHLTCHLPVIDLRRILRNAREAGIRNILALRGDPPIGADRWRPVEGGLANAVELVRLIREEHGDHFCVAVAGYPEVHTESWNHPDLPPSEQARDLDLERLKAKIDAGADFIITQFFFDVEGTIGWIKRCRERGIAVPILPGYLPVQNYRSFRKFTQWCKTAVPPEVERDLAKIRDDDEAVKAYGIDLAVNTCRRLRESGVRTLHFYTMNMSQAVTAILSRLALVPKASERELPWRKRPALGDRAKEEVRPIFWAHREASYLQRTAEWQEYPNGRWGVAANPAYGELTDYYLAFKRPKVDRRRIWGVPAAEADVAAVFVDYVTGRISEGLADESKLLQGDLAFINRHGFLTINSQPRVNGASSGDPRVGWGGEGGYVFQKAYLEFFCSPELLARVEALLPDYPALSLHAINRDGKEVANMDVRAGNVNAVTWGVFPGREIVQPTVVDPTSFRTWKEEAFELWMSAWAATYEDGADGAEPSEADRGAYEVLEGIYNSYFLVNIVDNDFSGESDVFSIFKRVILDAMTRDELRGRMAELEESSRMSARQVEELRVLQSQGAEELRQAHAEIAELRAHIAQVRAEMREQQVEGLLRLKPA